MTKKPKSIEDRLVNSLQYVGDIDDVAELTDESYELMDTMSLQRFIHFLDFEETTVVLLRYMGYQGKEIVSIMNLKDINTYYNISRSIRMHVHLFYTLYQNKLE